MPNHIKRELNEVMKFSNADICRAIANNTSLTQPEVKIVLNEFVSLIRNTMLSPSCPPYVEFPLGTSKEEVYVRDENVDVKKNKNGQPLTKEVSLSIGKIILRVRSGRKAGVHKIPAGFAGRDGETILELKEDEASFNTIEFAATPAFRKELKETSRLRSIRNGWRKQGNKLVYIDKKEEE